MVADGDGVRASRDVRARFAQVGVAFVLQAAILFGASGSFWWDWAWLYLGICTAAVTVNAAILMRRSPDLVAERGRPGRMPAWDVVLSVAWSLATYVALPLTAGLDARLGWTGEVPAVLRCASAVAMVAGFALAGWAMVANAFFSTAVRIQTERGHTVCTTGPYRFVRHPGYVGFVVGTLATALLLGSLWALVPAAFAAALIVVRTAVEDRTLRAELGGYEEYTTRVRWRLVPGVW